MWVCKPLPWTLSLPAFNQHKNSRAMLLIHLDPWDHLQDASLNPIEAKLCIISPTFPSHSFSKPLPSFPMSSCFDFSSETGGGACLNFFLTVNSSTGRSDAWGQTSRATLTGPFDRSWLHIAHQEAESQFPVVDSTFMMETYLTKFGTFHENFSITVNSDACSHFIWEVTRA